MKPLDIPQGIFDLAERLRTQDNRCTKHAMFCVQRHVVTIGLDESLTDDRAWMHQGEKVSEDWWPALNEAHDDSRATISIEGDVYNMGDFDRYGVSDHWETVMVSLTEQGAKDYIAANGHNLKSRGDEPPRIFVESFRRCHEMIMLRDWLMGLRP